MLAEHEHLQDQVQGHQQDQVDAMDALQDQVDRKEWQRARASNHADYYKASCERLQTHLDHLMDQVQDREQDIEHLNGHYFGWRRDLVHAHALKMQGAKRARCEGVLALLGELRVAQISHCIAEKGLQFWQDMPRASGV